MSEDHAQALRLVDDSPAWTEPALRHTTAASMALAQLADSCDRTRGANRDLDIRIALAVFPPMRLLRRIGHGVWAHPDGARVRALRYSSSSRAAMTLVPEGHWIECNPRAGGRIEIYGPASADVVGWARNDHFPLAATAAALRARAALLSQGAAAAGDIERAPLRAVEDSR